MENPIWLEGMVSLKMSDDQIIINRGYLNEEFHLYHLKDNRAQEIEYHYHEFDKIVILLSGKVSYIIEGMTYYLKPWDVLFVRHGSIHRPVIDQSEMYERIVIWMNKEFLDAHSYDGYDLSECFELTQARHTYLFRPPNDDRLRLLRLLDELEGSVKSSEYGSRLLARTYFLQLMVKLNRCMLLEPLIIDSSAFDIDPKVDEVLRYIGEHLSADLSISALAKRFYISRYHFMRRFKEATGFTIHGYVLQKRLSAASELLGSGMSAAEAASRVGFNDYSSFQRAFKQMFSLTPRQFTERKYKPWHSTQPEQLD